MSTRKKNKKVPKNTQLGLESTLRQLRKLLGENWEEILIKYPKDVIYLLENEKYTVNTLKSYFSRIVKYLRQLKEADSRAVNMSVIDKYKSKMDKYSDISYENDMKNLKNEKEQRKWLDWEDVIKVREKLLSYIHDENTYQNYLIVSLYTYLPPLRADYADMKIIRNNPRSAHGKEDNYLYFNKSDDSELILNTYKTAKHYGTLRIKIPRDLYEILYVWFSEYNTDMKYLLINKKGQPYNKDDLSKKVQRIFDSVIGKKVTISSLRHSYITHFFESTGGKISLKKKEIIARIMGHSIGRQNLYYKITGKESDDYDFEASTDKK